LANKRLAEGKNANSLNLEYAIELLGTAVFAISGALAVRNMQVDWLGAAFTGFVTAIGGGTLRDILLNAYPLVWISDGNVLWAVLVGLLLTFLFYTRLERLSKTLVLFDTIGIALFTILGTEKALSLDVSPFIAIIMGMFSATMGGVIRDTLTNRTPVIFRKEIYASPCLFGAFFFVLLSFTSLPRDLSAVTGISLIVTLRLLAVRYGWTLPSFDRSGGDEED
jgi:uncharacterized membrane protein YeiH